MAGLLTHLSAGFIGFLIIWFAFSNTKAKVKLVYGFIFAISNILPDLVDFGILSIVMGSLSPREIMTHELFHTFAVIGHTFSNWLILAFVVFVVVFLLHKAERVSRVRAVEVVMSLILGLIGIAIHLGLDVLIKETSYWI